MRLLITLVTLTTLSLKLTQAQETLAFVYELVRHGARAPIVAEPEGYFNVKMGLLTETGMR